MKIERSSHDDARLPGRNVSWIWRRLLPRPPHESRPAKVWMLICLALFFLLPLGWLFVMWGIGASMSAGSGGGRIGTGYAIFFVIITWSPLCLNFAAWKRSQSIIQRVIAALFIILFGLLAFASSSQLLHEFTRG
jgi:hypothetical protein